MSNHEHYKVHKNHPKSRQPLSRSVELIRAYNKHEDDTNSDDDDVVPDC